MITSLHLRITFWIAIVTWAAVLLLSGQTVATTFFKPAPMVLFVMTFLVTAYEKWIWRWSVLHPWLVAAPDLTGTYQGEVKSSWIDPATKQPIPPIVSYLVIRQTLLTINIRLYTGESESASFLATFVSLPDGTLELVYNYRNEPRPEVRPRSPIHYGATRMTFDRSAINLTGTYWTDRATTGEMRYTRISRDKAHTRQDCESLCQQAALPPTAAQLRATVEG